MRFFSIRQSLARFGEWSSACLSLQLEELTGLDSYKGPRIHYMAIFLEDDGALNKSWESNVAGKLIADWWDSSTDAGSKRRPRSSFNEPTPSLEVLTLTDDSVKNLRLMT